MIGFDEAVWEMASQAKKDILGGREVFVRGINVLTQGCTNGKSDEVATAFNRAFKTAVESKDDATHLSIMMVGITFLLSVPMGQDSIPLREDFEGSILSDVEEGFERAKRHWQSNHHFLTKRVLQSTLIFLQACIRHWPGRRFDRAFGQASADSVLLEELDEEVDFDLTETKQDFFHQPETSDIRTAPSSSSSSSLSSERVLTTLVTDRRKEIHSILQHYASTRELDNDRFNDVVNEYKNSLQRVQEHVRQSGSVGLAQRVRPDFEFMMFIFEQTTAQRDKPNVNLHLVIFDAFPGFFPDHNTSNSSLRRLALPAKKEPPVTPTTRVFFKPKSITTQPRLSQTGNSSEKTGFGQLFSRNKDPSTRDIRANSAGPGAKDSLEASFERGQSLAFRPQGFPPRSDTGPTRRQPTTPQPRNNLRVSFGVEKKEPKSNQAASSTSFELHEFADAPESNRHVATRVTNPFRLSPEADEEENGEAGAFNGFFTPAKDLSSQFAAFQSPAKSPKVIELSAATPFDTTAQKSRNSPDPLSITLDKERKAYEKAKMEADLQRRALESQIAALQAQIEINSSDPRVARLADEAGRLRATLSRISSLKPLLSRLREAVTQAKLRGRAESVDFARRLAAVNKIGPRQTIGGRAPVGLRAPVRRLGDELRLFVSGVTAKLATTRGLISKLRMGRRVERAEMGERILNAQTEIVELRERHDELLRDKKKYQRELTEAARIGMLAGGQDKVKQLEADNAALIALNVKLSDELVATKEALLRAEVNGGPRVAQTLRQLEDENELLANRVSKLLGELAEAKSLVSIPPDESLKKTSIVPARRPPEESVVLAPEKEKRPIESSLTGTGFLRKFDLMLDLLDSKKHIPLDDQRTSASLNNPFTLLTGPMQSFAEKCAGSVVNYRLPAESGLLIFVEEQISFRPARIEVNLQFAFANSGQSPTTIMNVRVLCANRQAKFRLPLSQKITIKPFERSTFKASVELEEGYLVDPFPLLLSFAAIDPKKLEDHYRARDSEAFEPSTQTIVLPITLLKLIQSQKEDPPKFQAMKSLQKIVEYVISYPHSISEKDLLKVFPGLVKLEEDKWALKCSCAYGSFFVQIWFDNTMNIRLAAFAMSPMPVVKLYLENAKRVLVHLH